MKGKEFLKVVVGAVQVLWSVSCGLQQDAEQATGRLSFAIQEPPASYYREGALIKSTAWKDTNAFILSVFSTGGSKIYEGKYGERPADFFVVPGGYEINLCSGRYSPPKFDSPVFGDSHTVIVKEEEQLAVKFRCSQVNAGVKLTFTEDFKKRFPGEGIDMVQGKRRLAYLYTESKYAYVDPGIFTLVYNGGEGDTVLLQKRVEKGQMAEMKLSHTVPDGYNAAFAVEVDTTRDWIASAYNTGLRIPTGAVTIEEAKRMTGQKNVAVFGFIYGGDPTTVAIRIAPPFTSVTTLVIAPAMSERNRNNCFVVELPPGKIRNELNLVGFPENLGRPVVITGEIVPGYFNYTGIRGTKAYAFLK